MNRRRRKRKTGLVDVAVEGGEDLMVMLILATVVVVVNRFRRGTVQWNDMIQKRRPNEWRMRMVVDGG